MKSFITEFKEFINRGNLLALATPFVIGAFLTAVVNFFLIALAVSSMAPRPLQAPLRPTCWANSSPRCAACAVICPEIFALAPKEHSSAILDQGLVERQQHRP